MLRYLGLVNALALLPAAVLIAGIADGAGACIRLVRRPEVNDVCRRGVSLIFLMSLSTLLGYMWFVLSYPRPDDGDTVKATYVVQLVPLLALLGADALVRLRAASGLTFRVVATLLVMVVVIVAPTWHSQWRSPLDCLLASYER
jgi:hypothetical protein